MSNQERQLQTLKGFQDFLPDDMRLREYVINTFKKVFEKYGYEPLETPALEYAETLFGISGEEAEKLFYRFTDNGGRDVVMRYEVMVPMCRVIAQYKNQLTFPFKRYQIQRVWRAENVQKGRLREFTQCDADTIGTSSMIADAEFIQMGIEILNNFGFREFYAQISNRKLLDGMLSEYQIPENKFYGVCMTIDNIRKIGRDGVIERLMNKENLSKEVATKIVKIIEQSGTNEEKIKAFRKQFSENKKVSEALDEVEEILNYLEANKVNSKYYRFDPTIARGLAHYTGPVWEFEITEGNVGSVAGCGRYDNVISKYLGTDEIIPATGGSFGIERMMIVLKERQMVDFLQNSTQVLVTIFNEKTKNDSIKLANELRETGINTFLYPEPGVKLDKQLKLADRKVIPVVLILGPEEITKNEVVIKWMQQKKQEKVKLSALIRKLKG
ncbi:histidine--tRNA ligase [candidate division CPR3 bacterium GWF2_35_18]|uniref:Histidine--tRNA ligase n=1 Tax=candidate division CPR3 bacterium GW2011_GWF2_35_18 TaxID=1618350 RepID=A0A0G0C1D0_UNCC3|nr:MAG: Histidyl-tRNA synthetase [candidate division CPR3 bacterium GW2011_GWF2_35_18]OGB62698.1 MAG: histidine--tRNA ligase [candidate division CPR3 bacterium GWF2_35_18]OGB65724.1 MAG: histidine--tRNA ligase [candidate division CPR3 bacterium RIFOXYA2_FULL_35_13]OGB76235.1 MAG: histidine--tRNA ligase [candidate division CPR3 bacterium RIFOXYC2_FULL_35_7]OGB78687.1 MAG: histidine--tRNA ligase [candidate division CPR3 bacterium RIFOXYB2_FULL_35_8]